MFPKIGRLELFCRFGIRLPLRFGLQHPVRISPTVRTVRELPDAKTAMSAKAQQILNHEMPSEPASLPNKVLREVAKRRLLALWNPPKDGLDFLGSQTPWPCKLAHTCRLCSFRDSRTVTKTGADMMKIRVLPRRLSMRRRRNLGSAVIIFLCTVLLCLSKTIFIARYYQSLPSSSSCYCCCCCCCCCCCYCHRNHYYLITQEISTICASCPRHDHPE